jgi:TolA-binding protein
VNPNMPSASALLGISLYALGEYSKARPRLETAVRANPGENNAQLFLVTDLTKLGDHQTASSRLQEMANRKIRRSGICWPKRT